MSSYRLASKHDAFVRDLLRDYCAVYLALAKQNQRYQRDGSMSYAVLNSLIGTNMSKGVFWRLKDTAHYLFRHPIRPGEQESAPDQYEVVGSLIDWCVGYAFHECGKLREDAFQGQHYAIRLIQLARTADFARELASPLTPLTDQTAKSCKREMNRILHVLRSGMLFLIRYLPTAAENCSVARWLATDRESAMQAFGHLYPGLVRSLYGDNPKHVYTLAACDLLDCGRIDETHALLSKAREEGKLDIDGMSILFAIEHSGDDKKGLSYFRDPGAAGGCFKG